MCKRGCSKIYTSWECHAPSPPCACLRATLLAYLREPEAKRCCDGNETDHSGSRGLARCQEAQQLLSVCLSVLLGFASASHRVALNFWHGHNHRWLKEHRHFQFLGPTWSAKGAAPPKEQLSLRQSACQWISRSASLRRGLLAYLRACLHACSHALCSGTSCTTCSHSGHATGPAEASNSDMRHGEDTPLTGHHSAQVRGALYSKHHRRVRSSTL